MKTKLSKRFWVTLALFSFTGQIAWVVENMYFNVFIYKMFHASATEISTMVAASSIVAALTTLLIGALSDKVGKRKVFISVGYLFWGLSILAFAFIRIDVIKIFVPPSVSAAAVGVTLVILMDCIMTFFGSSANDAGFNAWLTDKSDKTNRGSIEGINSMMPLVAILAVFGGFMFFDLDNTRSWVIIYLIIGIFVMISGVLGIFIIEEKPVKQKENKNYFKSIIYGFQPSVMKENPILYLTLAAFAVFGVSIQIFMPYLILYYEVSLGISDYVLIMAPAIIIASIITAFYGKTYDRFRFQKSVIPTIIILMLGYIVLYFFKGTSLVFLGSLFMMIGYLTGMAVFGAMIRDYTPVDKAGQFQGLRIMGQVFIPGMIGPGIGAWVLKNAKMTVNSDSTTSFIPNEKIFAAAFIVSIFIWILLIKIFHLIKKEHVDLLTIEGEQLLDKPQFLDKPWQEYPRPQLKRESYLNLNGKWKFAVTRSKNIPVEFPMNILVPFPPESKLSGIKRIPRKNQYLYYHRKFIIPEGFIKDKVLLHFGGVDQIATVYINGNEKTTHTGGYLPFTVDITDDLIQENTVVIKVEDHLRHDLPYGKQKRKRGGMWYTSISGIWQTVWLESVSTEYIRGIKMVPTLNSVTIHVDSDATTKEILIKTEKGMIHKLFEEKEITIGLDEPKLWSPESPYLYEFEIKTKEDKINSYFALRTLTIEKRDNTPRLCLNGEPYFFHGLLDQGYFSDGIYLPASVNGFYKDITMMKELGFNTLRKHIKIEPALYYHLCDKLGMVVFQDMVNMGSYSFLRDTVLPTIGFNKVKDIKSFQKKKVMLNFKRFTKETIQHLYNYPSICYWTIFNEGWGQFSSDLMYEMVKKYDHTRFIDSTSGWFWQKTSDVLSMHIYFKPIVIKNDGRPVVLSEFGGYSYKVKEHSYNHNKGFGYRFYEDQKKFQTALNEVYLNVIANQIKNGLCASIYTQVSDVEDETNGLLTYDRRVLKVNREQMLKIAKALKIKKESN
ncbi:MAG TPA: MFS transporter [Lachnospiraceae bacterium]|nr:MFS transporter [Lachnospiraceae bacterium]